MPKETLNVGQIAQDVAEQVAEMVANSVATTKTNQLLTAAASAETARVNAENARASAESARAAAETARATEFAGFEDEIDSKLSKGDYDATTGVGYADNADQLNSPDFTTDQAPYLYRTSGGDADIGNREKDTIVGGSLGWNQLVENGNFADDSGWYHVDISQFSVSNNICSFTVNAQGQQVTHNTAYITGHKYLAVIEVKLTTGNTNVFLRTVGQNRVATKNTTNWQTLSAIFTSHFTGENSLGVRDERTSGWDEIQCKNAICIDLTAIFGATIADYIYSLETATAGAGVAWFRKLFPKPYYPYKAIGGFLHVKLISHDMVHFNAFDIDAISSQTYATATISGTQITLTGTYYASWAIRLIKGMAYYIKADVSGALPNGMFRFVYEDGALSGTYIKGSIFTPTKDVSAVLIYASDDGTSKTTVYNNVNINLSWSGWRNGQYEPYKKVTYPLDTSVILRGIPKLDADNNLYYDGDKYHGDGSVEELAYEVDGGDLDWQFNSTSGAFEFNLATVEKPKAKTVLFCTKYAWGGIKTDPELAELGVGLYSNGGNWLAIKDPSFNGDASAFKTAMAGIPILFLVNAPTTSQADPFQETQEVDDFGTEEYVVPEQDGVSVPVGHYTEYPENLRDKLRRLPNMPTVSEATTATYVVNYNGQTKKCSFVPINDWLVANGYPTGDSLKEVLASKEALGGTLRQVLAATKSIDFASTAFVDLGNVTWVYGQIAGGANGFIATVNGLKAKASASEISNMLCSKYQSTTAQQTYDGSKIGISSLTQNNYIAVYDPSAGTDVTAFKAAMQGVLLAYEKASS